MKHHPPKASSPAKASGDASSFATIFMSLMREQRKKGLFLRGLFQQQKDMAVSDRQVQFIAEAKASAKTLRHWRVNPTRVESFESAVARQGLTPEFLQAQMQRHKWVHLILYLAAGTLLAYAFWLFLNVGAMPGIVVAISAVGVAVNGYIHAFRAWQIEHRALIRLQDALRIPSTYLVL